MKAETLTIKKIFGKDIRYLVPLFQRPYVWSKEDHWEPLWLDITSVAERLLKELQSAADAASAEEATPPHFLGAVVVDQVKNAVAEIETRNVIDGQQRLTTLQLLLDAVQATVAGLGEQKVAKLLAKLILNDEDVITQLDHRFKIWPTIVDQDVFRAVMDDEGDSAAHAESPIAQAHEFFGAAAAEWITEVNDADEQTRRTAALSTTLQGLLHVVIIDLEPHDNAQAIFETLNARGTPLLASDLIKNLLLQQAQAKKLDVQALYDTHWRAFDEREYWRKEVRQGRLTRTRIDVFLYYWLIMRTAAEVSAQEVFREFRKYLEVRANGDVSAVLADLSGSGRTYRKLDELPTTSREGSFVYRWLVLDAQALTPVVLWLFSQPGTALAAEERLRALCAIESWLVRRTICRLTTKGYNMLFLDLLKALGATPAKAGAITEKFLAEQTADARLWPSDDALVQACLEVPLYSLLTRGRLRMILEALEDSHRSPKSEEEFVNRGKLTIEHVMPQAWRQHWPAPDGDDQVAAAAHRNRLVHTLGNLTLVTSALNPALSNSPWQMKRPELAKHTVLHLNKGLSSTDQISWDDAEIVKRGREMGERLVTVWPRP